MQLQEIEAEAAESHYQLPDGPGPRPEPDTEPGAPALKRWLMVTVVAGCTAAVILMIAIAVLANNIQLKNREVGSLVDNLSVVGGDADLLNRSVNVLKDSVRYHACFNRRVLDLDEDIVTGIVAHDKGYVVATFNEADNKTMVRFLSESLAVLKQCDVNAVENVKMLVRQKIFWASADEAVLYSYPNLYFLNRDNCHLHGFNYADKLIAGVLETDKSGEYLVAYTYDLEQKLGPMYIALVDSKSGKSVWDMKEVNARDCTDYISNAEMIRLKDGRFAINYLAYFDHTSSPNKERTLAKHDDNAGATAAPRTGEALSLAHEVKRSCISMIDLGKDHSKKENVKINSLCDANTGYDFMFAMAETDKQTILSLAMDANGNLVVLETKEDLKERLTKVVIKKVTGALVNFNDAYRVSATKYAFSLSNTVDPKAEVDLAEAFIYDYASNKIVSQARINTDTNYVSGIINTAVTHLDGSRAVFAMASRDGVAILSVNGGTPLVQEQHDVGFWHMAPARDGGYLVNKGIAQHAGVLWTYYPWQDRDEEQGRLNCTPFI